MKTLTIHLPEMVELEEHELKMLLAAKLYEQGTLSLGQAAEVAGYSKRTFMELLGNYGVSALNYPASDLAQDLANVQRHHI
jgi:predicted HTH domain antitoxin